MTPVEHVRVCRSCGRIDPADSTGKCPTCRAFFELAVVPRPEAEQLARQPRRHRQRRRLRRLLLALTVGVGLTVWIARAVFDLAPPPPRATTNLSTSSAPHTWAQLGRTPEQSGFTLDPAPWPHRVKWRQKVATSLLAAPAVVESHIYLTTGDGRTLALDRHTGEPVWVYQSGWPSSSTPAIAGEMVIFAVRPGRVVAVHRQTGVRRWETNLQHPILASPIVVQGSVYIGAADKHLYALDVATGQQRWASEVKDWIVSAAAYADSRVIVASRHSSLHVVDAATGRQRLAYDTGLGRHIGGGAAIQGDQAYFGSFGGRVWAIAWRATTYRWDPMLLFWKTNLYLWGMLSTPPVQKGSVWSRYIGGDVPYTPALAHGMVYVTTSRRLVMALDSVTGSTQWSAELDVVPTTAPTVAGTAILVGTKDGRVFSLHAYTGEVLWAFKMDNQISASPIVAGDTMYLVSVDGTLAAVTEK